MSCVLESVLHVNIDVTWLVSLLECCHSDCCYCIHLIRYLVSQYRVDVNDIFWRYILLLNYNNLFTNEGKSRKAFRTYAICEASVVFIIQFVKIIFLRLCQTQLSISVFGSSVLCLFALMLQCFYLASQTVCVNMCTS